VAQWSKKIMMTNDTRRGRRLCVLPLALAFVGIAASSARGDESPVLTKEELVARHPQLRPENVADGPIDALYEVHVDGKITYVTTDGRYLIRGEIIDLASTENLTETRRAAYRAELLRTIDPRSEIVFTPKNGIVNYRVTVFTDVDCGYCRQMHRDIAAFNALGIEVRYASYPRTGPDTESWTTAEHVWCAADRNAALTSAKLGADVPATPGCAAPIAAHYELGRRLGMAGTPGVYADDGAELGGYVPPAALLELLEKHAAPQ
jgi:thiol:disulfide interchange protein DsbC